MPAWMDRILGRVKFLPSDEHKSAEEKLREMDERIDALEQQVTVIRLGMLRGRSGKDRKSA